MGELRSDQFQNGFKNQELLASLGRVLKLRIDLDMQRLTPLTSKEIDSFTNLKTLEVFVKQSPEFNASQWEQLAFNIRTMLLKCA